jgi:hypothetical protein
VSGADPLTHRRLALWGALLSKVVAAWGLAWDIQWHMTIGRDSFWIAPHLMIYASVVAGLALGWGVLAYEWWRGIPTTRGFRLAALGLVLVVLAAPIDDLWHRLFGLDVTLWSPPHLLALLGSAVSTLGCLLIALEVYPLGSRAARAAFVLAGALLYGGVRVTLDPTWLYAYSYGGVLFHGFAILAALILPLALVTTARVSALRWAPALAVLLSFAIGLAGQQIASLGFAIIRPVSFIDEEVAKDTSSPIAVGREIAEKNRAVPPPSWPLRLALPLVPAALLALADARRRPVGAAVVYAVSVFAAYAWFLSTLPAYAPVVPAGAATAAALAIAAAGGAAGGLAARWLAAQLVRGAPERATVRTRPLASLT